MVDTGIKGIQLFRATEAVPCVPPVYAPCVIVSGGKEAVLDGQRHAYASSQYM
ncbi:hypothetical protein NBRC116599_37580 [Aquicoccus sp. SU-CL01552]